MKTLRLILGDQLSSSISSLKDCIESDDLILMCEVVEETNYVKHHKKKIAFLFSAMRHFAQELVDSGFKVKYFKLDDSPKFKSFYEAVEHTIDQYKIGKVIITEPGEYRLAQEFSTWSDKLDIEVKVLEDDRFLCSIQEFKDWAAGRKQLRMEYFYREMRQRYSILMDDGQPAGGKWNYDADNRKPAKSNLQIPAPYNGEADSITADVLKLVEDYFPDHFGDLQPFYFAVTREQALQVLEKFTAERLINFGDYQDAMLQGEPWMFHSHISFYLNCGLLTPMECIRAAEGAYYQQQAPLNAVEGFI